MPTVLVTGANRGLGLEFCSQYLGTGWQVLACCRDPDSAEGLRRIDPHDGRLITLRLDIAVSDTIGALAESLRGHPIDVLINNAGVYGDTPDAAFGRLDYDRWLDVLRVNTLGPVRLTEALMENLRAGEKRVVASVTSMMGSIADNTSGGSILYRSSKAALNAAMRSLSIDLAPLGISVLILHPGWVKTDMGGPRAPTTAEESVSGMRRVIAEHKPAHSGRFLDFRGKERPW